MAKSKSKISVNEAYCLELGDNVTVKQMEQFLNSPLPIAHPHFLCATEACKEKEVRMSIVGYEQRLHGESSDVPIHFRLFPKHRHDENCQWHPKHTNQPKNLEQSEQDSKDNLAHHSTPHNPKQDGKINYFNMTLDSDILTQEPIATSSAQLTNHSELNSVSANGSNNYQRTSTSSFDRIVDEYIALEQQQILDAPLTIRGLGTKTYRKFFWSHTNINYNFEKFILFGNLSRFVTEYENSICLYFFDKINNLKGDLYIDFNQYEDNRRKEFLLKTITECNADDIKYFRAFFIATNRSENNYTVKKDGQIFEKTKYGYTIPSLEYLQIKRYPNKI